MSENTHFYDYMISVYMQGMAGSNPPLPLTLAELEAEARAKLDPCAYWYVAGGAGLEDTLDQNRAMFRRIKLMPKVCRDVSVRNWNTDVLKTRLKAPIVLAPIGVQEIVHPEAELAVARAAASLGISLALSTLSSYSLEDVAKAMSDVPRWFQLYPPKDLDLAKSLIRRAEAAGYSAILITVDTRQIGYRWRDLREAYLPFLRGQGIKNYLTDPVFRASLEEPPEQDLQAAVARWAEIYEDSSQTWDTFARLRDETTLPIAIKGVLHPEDVRKAVELGFDGIVISNHGGRQVDGCIAPIEALPHLAAITGERIDLILDSGVRGGSDVVKALALGARAVLLGRPYVWGLAVAGEDGVREVVQRVLAEFDVTCALCGATNVNDLRRDLVRVGDTPLT
jgi:isopentenyl diphosphate isomerase/L-lactate dehydrogenase-like FMN-dependent dehydrogenase